MSLYGSRKLASSTTSLASSTDLGTTDIKFEDVEFGADESKEALEAQRNAKSHGAKGKTSTSKVCHRWFLVYRLMDVGKIVVDVAFESADVNLIAAEERETGKPAQPAKRRTFTKNDLPIKLSSDHQIWNNNLQPELIEWCGMHEGQFSFSNDLQFREIVKALWDKHLGSLPHISDTYKSGATVSRCRDHPAVLSFVCDSSLLVPILISLLSTGPATSTELPKQNGTNWP